MVAKSLDNESASNASLFVGMAPDASNRFLIFGTAANEEPGLARINTPTRYFVGERDFTSIQGGTGWSHSFGDRNVLTGAIYANRGLDRRYTKAASFDLDPIIAASETWERNRTEGVVAALNHSIGINDFTLRYGFESQVGKTFDATFGQGLFANRVTGQTAVRRSDQQRRHGFPRHAALCGCVLAPLRQVRGAGRSPAHVRGYRLSALRHAKSRRASESACRPSKGIGSALPIAGTATCPLRSRSRR